MWGNPEGEPADIPAGASAAEGIQADIRVPVWEHRQELPEDAGR